MNKKLALLLGSLLLLSGCQSKDNSPQVESPSANVVSETESEKQSQISESKVDVDESVSQVISSPDSKSEDQESKSDEVVESDDSVIESDDSQSNSEEDVLDPQSIEDAITAVNNYIDSKDENNYSASNYESLMGMKDLFKLAANLVKSEDELLNLMQQCKDAVDELPTYDFATLRTNLEAEINALAENEDNQDILKAVGDALSLLANTPNEVEDLQKVVDDVKASVKEIKDSLTPVTPLPLTIANVECYGDWFMKVTFNEFAYSDLKQVVEISMSNNETTTSGEQYAVGTGTCIRFDATGRDEANKTVGTTFTAHVKVELNDGKIYEATFDVENGKIAVPVNFEELRTSLLAELDALLEGVDNQEVIDAVNNAKELLGETEDDKALLEKVVSDAKAKVKELLEGGQEPVIPQMNVASVECYADWFMKVVTYDFPYSDLKNVLAVSLSNNSAATCGEKYQFGANGTCIRLDANERGATNKTVGTEFTAYIKVELNDGTIYEATFDVENGKLATLDNKKSAATETVNGYFTEKGYVENLYTEENWNTLQGLKTTALEAISNATDKQAVVQIVTDFKTNSDNVPQRELDLSEIVATKVAELQAYADSKPRVLYSDTNWEELQGYVTFASEACAECTSESDVAETISSYQTLIDEVAYQYEVKDMTVASVECYADWFMKVVTYDFSYSTDFAEVMYVSMSNNSAAICGEKFQFGPNGTCVRLDANERGSKNKTVGTTFTATVILKTKDDAVHMATFKVENGKLA